MTNNLNELVEKVLKDMTIDHAADRDVRALIEFALGQHDTIDLLVGENLELTARVDDLTEKVASLTTRSSLLQFQDESALL